MIDIIAFYLFVGGDQDDEKGKGREIRNKFSATVGGVEGTRGHRHQRFKYGAETRFRDR